MSKEIPPHLLPAVAHVLAHTATPDERKAVRDWFYADMPETVLEVHSPYSERTTFNNIFCKLQAEIRQDIPRRSGRMVRWPRIAQAAAVITLVVLGYYLWRPSFSHPSPDSPIVQPVATTNSRLDTTTAPGGKKARLLLSDGTTIALDSVAPGFMRKEGNSTLHLRTSGMLTYEANDVSDKRTTTTMTNTLTVPLGGEFTLLLPDGSRVWLNAGTTLHYPSSFAGATTRMVQLSGEAYFDIAPHAQQPFHVQTGEADILALGTQFNVNTYEQGFTRATLTQGKIQVAKQGGLQRTPATPVILHPGEQAEVGPATRIVITEKNTHEAIAWKDGDFRFTGNTLPEVMDQLSRWYTLTVEYPTPVPAMQLVGGFSRQYTLKQALAWLAGMGVHYRQQGHHIQLLP